jgi:hypothetical protein
MSQNNNVGSVESQGAVAINAPKARDITGVDGTGVTVGVISDSYNNLGGADADIASGDLPEQVQVLKDSPEGGSDEGRAIMQLVHDVAPGADFAFHTPGETKEDYTKAIKDLADTGVDIIVSDVGLTDESMFQDDIVSQTINEVTSRPGDEAVVFFAGAGNSGSRSYQSSFNPSGQTELEKGGEYHDFDSGEGVDTLQSIKISKGSGVGISFQWDSPFASIGDSAGSQNDLDIFLLDSSGTKVLASSTESNVGGDPVESLIFNNDLETEEFNIAISKKSGSNPGSMKYVVNGGGKEFKINEYDTASGTIQGVPNAEGAAAVGAANYSETPAFGTDPAQIRYFSSTGGTPTLFDTKGDPLAPTDRYNPNDPLMPGTREKPEFVAPDGVNNTFFGEDIPEDDDTFPNFAGTSASVAYPAGVAALMLEANPNLSPDEIYSTMQKTALDMDDPSTPGFDTGFDYATGYGLIQADDALGVA